MAALIEIGDHEELVGRCEADTLCLWAAQGPDGRSRAWRSADGRAVAVAGPGLSTRDRLAALMVEERNHAARRIYSGLGLRYRPLAAAAVPG